MLPFSWPKVYKVLNKTGLLEALGISFGGNSLDVLFWSIPEAGPPKAQIAALDRFQPPNGSDKDSLKAPKRVGILADFREHRSEIPEKDVGWSLGRRIHYASLLRISVVIN